MRAILRPVVAAMALAFTPALTILAPGAAWAQSEPAQEAPKQIALTEKQVVDMLAAKPEMDAILAKVPEDAEPDAKVLAQLDVVAKKHGFSGYPEYDDVDSNVGLALAGFDPQTKKYVGGDVVLKQQIAEIQADKKMPAADKKEALKQLNDALKSVAPLQFPANADIVAKYFDKLNEAPSQNQ